MRYRPLGTTGRTVSAVMLAVAEAPRRPADRVALTYAALESGVNAFELRTPDPEVARALGQGLSAVEREMAVVGLRLRPEGRGVREQLVEAVEVALLASRLGWLDFVVLDGWGALAPEDLSALAAAKDSGRVTAVALAGEAFERSRHRAEIDGLACAYSLRAGWPERNRIRSAVDRGKFVLGQDSYPDLGAASAGEDVPAAPAAPRGLLGLGRNPPAIERTGGYEFMRRTPGWTPDEICLAYALTEPSLATVLIEAETPEAVERLAAVTDRELPTGLPAQIEMARFAPQG